MSAWLDGLARAFWAGVAAAAFGVLFNVPPRALLTCALSGALGFSLRAILVANDFTLPTATFAAATLVSVFATQCGNYQRAPAVVFVVPGIIPLIPGALAFRFLADILSALSARDSAQHEAFVAALVNGLRTSLCTAALATGVAVPSLLLRRHRPMT